MALLINKPKRVVINTTATLTLNRAELVGYFAENAYFSSTSNWDKVYFYYKDASGKQNISVVFPSGSNQATFSPSSKVRQSRWTLDKIVVRDFDRGFVALKRSSYYSALSECDIVVAVPNRTPSDIALSNSSILENTTFVGNLTATDPDIEDPLVYSVVSGFGDAASFQIVGNNALHFVNAPNYEIKNQYSVKIRVTDSSDVFYEEAFTINVVDANDAPGNITLSNNTIGESASVNTIIGTLAATDEDSGNVHTFSIIGGDVSAFNISGNQLRSSIVFDYENKASYSITVRATDSGGLIYDKSFNISVLNVNETPTGITLSNNSISELNSVNAVVGMFTTTDPDGDSSFVYSLISGDTSSFNISGNQLRASEVFDFETKSSYAVTVRSTDAGGLSTTQAFTININNTTEAPTNISLSNNSIDEYTQPINTVIGTLSATAPTGQSVAYSLVGGDVASFNINGNQLRSSVVFDFEIKSSYSVTIRASVGGEYFDKVFAIYVNDISNMRLWTATGNMNSGKEQLGGLGTQNAALVFGGRDDNTYALSTSEKFNGSTWSMSGSTSIPKQSVAGVGTQDAGLSFGGRYIPSGLITENKSPAEKFNGSTWSTTGDLLKFMYGLAGAGTQNAALAFGGTDGTSIWVRGEKFNGSTWLGTGGDINFPRYFLAGCGTQDSALAFGGRNSSSVMASTEKFNGSTWSFSNGFNLGSLRYGLGGCGTQDAAIAFGGRYGNSIYSTSEAFNGSVWSAIESLAVARFYCAAAGTQTAALAFGGYDSIYSTSNRLSSTEKYVVV